LIQGPAKAGPYSLLLPDCDPRRVDDEKPFIKTNPTSDGINFELNFISSPVLKIIYSMRQPVTE
jgi:hypothetical protein